MPALHPDRQPWPMKWIVVAIIMGIGVYTYLTLHFRKAEPAFRPYEDTKIRANTIRLLAAGFQRVVLAAQGPSDPAAFEPMPHLVATPGGVPEELKSTLVDSPLLATEIVRVGAASSVSAVLAYPIQFSCTLPDHHRQLTGAELYLKGETLIFIPTFDRLTSDLLARTRESVVLLTVPAGTLKPGRYEATLVGERASKSWTVQVR